MLYSTTENQFSLMVVLWQFTAAVVEMSRMCCIAESSSYASSITTAWCWSDVTTSHAWTYDATDGSGTSRFIFCVSSTALFTALYWAAIFCCCWEQILRCCYGIQLLTPNSLAETWRRICSLDIQSVSTIEVLCNSALQIHIYLIIYLLTYLIYPLNLCSHSVVPARVHVSSGTFTFTFEQIA